MLQTTLIAYSLFALCAAAASEPAEIPPVDETPINDACPVTGAAIGEGAPMATLWGHAVAFEDDEARAAFLAMPAVDRERGVLLFLAPLNDACPVDDKAVDGRSLRALSGGFPVGLCSKGCKVKFEAWKPGEVGAFLARHVAPINGADCPMTGDGLVDDDPYFVAQDGRLLQLCCDYCLMVWEFQPAKREAALRTALAEQGAIGMAGAPE